MEATVLRDGLTLRGFYDVPAGKPAFDCAIIFHGFTGNCGRQKERIEYQAAQTLLNAGMAVARFDFNGHGKSDGRFEDMTVLNELDDARAILRFVRQQPGVQRIMLVGMSQGGVVASMLAGYYHDEVDKVVLMYPAATLKEDAQHGEMQGLHYDPQQIPAVQVWHSDHGDFSVGDFYFRTAQTLPIYEVAKQYRGPVLLMHGDADPIVPRSASERYLSGYQHAEYHVIPGGDHGFHAPAARKEALRLLEEFVEKNK